MVSDSAAGESRPADAETEFETGFDGPDDQPRVRKRRVKVRRKQEKFSHALRIAILIGAPTLLWIGIYLIARALL